MGFKQRRRLDLSDMEKVWGYKKARYNRRGGAIVGLALVGKLGPRSRASVLELDRLEYLDVSLVTGLSNGWFSKIVRLPGLRVLCARETCFADEVADALAESRSLEAIDISKSRAGAPVIEALAGLDQLRVVNCTVDARPPDAALRKLERLPALERLSVVRPQSTQKGARDLAAATIAAFRRFPALTRLSIYNLIDTSSRFSGLAGAPKLLGLGLGGNYHGGTQKWIRALADFPDVRYLDLGHSYFRKPDDLEPLMRMKSLVELSLAHAHFDDRRLPDWSIGGIERLVYSAGWLHDLITGAESTSGFSEESGLGTNGRVSLPPDLAALAPPPAAAS